METIQIPVSKGTPVKQVLESFIRAMVSFGYRQDVLESEIYWAMQERRMESRRFEGSPSDV